MTTERECEGTTRDEILRDLLLCIGGEVRIFLATRYWFCTLMWKMCTGGLARIYCAVHAWTYMHIKLGKMHLFLDCRATAIHAVPGN